MTREVFAPATLTVGFHDNEVLAVVGKNHSAYVDVANIRAERLPERGDLIEGQVKVYLIEAGADDSLVELPGVAVGALRGRVANSLLREVGE